MVVINWFLGLIPSCQWRPRCITYSIAPPTWDSTKLMEVCSSLAGRYRRCQVWPGQLGLQHAITDNTGTLMTYVNVSGFPSLSPFNSTWVTVTDAHAISTTVDDLKGVSVCGGPLWHESEPDIVIYIYINNLRAHPH